MYIKLNDNTRQLLEEMDTLQKAVNSPFVLDTVSGVVSCSNKKQNKELIDSQNTIISSNLSKVYLVSDFNIKILKSTIQFNNFEFIHEIQTKSNLIDESLKHILKNVYVLFQSTFENFVIYTLLPWLSEFDLRVSVALVAIKNTYTRPIFEPKVHGVLKISSLRHPIVEQNNKNVLYIPNDIDLSISGILLYGINSSGKSTLIKSVGIAVILAQCGMYVPCKNYHCSIIDAIFVRLPGSDNITTVDSSFTLEVKDIRNIISNATNQSLVLADEICSSTETVSGISIIGATIKSISDIGCKYIVSSHLSELLELNVVKDYIKQEKCTVFHLSISKGPDHANPSIVFNRKLTKGPFHSLYGLEICKSLSMPQEFLDVADCIRKELIQFKSKADTLIPSVYNSDKFYTETCEICNGGTNFHIHHIRYQKDADTTTGIIDHHDYHTSFHKNEKFNLVCVCDTCHHKIHNGSIVVNGYISTTNGIILDYMVV
jgi:DNA mismatch repair protein MutS